MRTRRRRIPVTPMVQVTSMMDMFTIILVFLLTFLDPAVSQSEDLSLPTSSTGVPATEGRTLTVSRDAVLLDGVVVLPLVERDGVLAFPDGSRRDGRLVSPLFERLAASAPMGTPTTPGSENEKRASEAILRVECDRGVPFSVLGDVLFTAGQVGFQEFRFVVISEDG